MKQQSFFQANKVMIIGLLTSVALAVNELIKGGESSTKVLVFAAIMAAVSFLANNLRGQWATIAGIVGNGLATYLTMQEQGQISWAQLSLQAVIAFLAVLSAPAKSRGYEHTATIENAKEQGERIKPSVASSK